MWRSALALRKLALVDSFDEKRPDGQRVRSGSPKHIDRFGGCADYRLAVDVEARVEYGADSPTRLRLPQQRGKLARIGIAHQLRSTRAVDADDAGQSAAEAAGHGIGHRHRPIRRARPVRENTRRFALEHAGAERLIPDAPLEHEIQAV